MTHSYLEGCPSSSVIAISQLVSIRHQGFGGKKRKTHKCISQQNMLLSGADYSKRNPESKSQGDSRPLGVCGPGGEMQPGEQIEAKEVPQLVLPIT